MMRLGALLKALREASSRDDAEVWIDNVLHLESVKAVTVDEDGAVVIVTHGGAHFSKEVLE
jgi:hypothetical protein